MKGMDIWHGIRVLAGLSAGVLMLGLLAACSVVLTGEDGKQLLGVQAERSGSLSSNAVPPPLFRPE